MGESQDHRRATFWGELIQHGPKPRRPLRRVEIHVERGQRLELLLRRRLIDVDAGRLPAFQHCVLLHEIVRDRVEVVDRISNRILVFDPQHAQVNLLRQIRYIGLAPDAPPEERVQGCPVLGKQPLNQRWFRISYGHGDT